MTGSILGDCLKVKKFLQTKDYPVSDFVWAYLQVESVNGRMCCGNFDLPIGRLILRRRNGGTIILQYEGVDTPKQLLEELSAKNPQMDVGFTEENKKKYGN